MPTFRDNLFILAFPSYGVFLVYMHEFGAFLSADVPLPLMDFSLPAQSLIRLGVLVLLVAGAFAAGKLYEGWLVVAFVWIGSFAVVGVLTATLVRGAPTATSILVLMIMVLGFWSGYFNRRLALSPANGRLAWILVAGTATFVALGASALGYNSSRASEIRTVLDKGCGPLTQVFRRYGELMITRVPGSTAKDPYKVRIMMISDFSKDSVSLRSADWSEQEFRSFLFMGPCHPK